MTVRRRTRGFSLIELMVVVVILGIGLTSVSMLFATGIISNTKAERINIATHAAQKQVERLRSAGFNGCVADPEVFAAEDGYTILEQQPNLTGVIGFAVPELPSAQGTIEIRLYQAATGYYPNLKTCTATVTYPGGGPTGGTVTLQTLIANRP